MPIANPGGHKQSDKNMRTALNLIVALLAKSLELAGLQGCNGTRVSAGRWAQRRGVRKQIAKISMSANAL